MADQPAHEREAASRRSFLAAGGALTAAAAMPGVPVLGRQPEAPSGAQAEPDEPAPPAAVTAATLAAAEKLAGISFSDTERAQMLESIGEHLARLERRQGSPLVGPETSMALAFDPRLPGMSFDHLEARCTIAAQTASGAAR